MTLKTGAVLAVAALSLPAAALAEETAPLPAAPAQAVQGQSFTPEYFARFSPQTALDMLRQVPGFSLREDGGGERGLGEASGNVLVNGQRLVNKTEGIEAQLARIPAKNVLRIELVEAATLKVPGLTGQVANIVSKQDNLTGTFAWQPQFRPHYADPLWLKGDVSISGKAGRLGYTLGISNQGNRGAAGPYAEIRNAAGALIETRDGVLKSNFDQPKLTAVLKYSGPHGEEANLNFTLRRALYDFTSEEDRLPVGGTAFHRTYTEREHSTNYEVGGDLAFKLGDGRLKLIGLQRYNPDPFRVRAINVFADARPNTGDAYEQDASLLERIARAEYGWKMAGGDWQLSAEAAFNTYKNTARLFELDPAGKFQEIPFPQGSGGVHEDRYESVLSYSRKLSPKLSLQLSAGGEFSRLSQTGASAVRREFWRPKGSLSLAWAPVKGLDISFKARRRVGQLDFGDFLADVDLNNSSNNAGNADLVPPQSWEFELETKKSLGKWGTTTLRLYDYRISDFVDIVPIGVSGESPGNIDGARRIGLEWNSTIQLVPIGFKGAQLQVELELERGRINDPLTGQRRDISWTMHRRFEIGLRHDIPGSDWAWGAEFENFGFGQYYRLTEVGRDFEGPNWAEVFVENKDVFGLTVKASVHNLLNAKGYFDRTVWNGYRDRSGVRFTEKRVSFIGPIFAFSVKGSF